VSASGRGSSSTGTSVPVDDSISCRHSLLAFFWGQVAAVKVPGRGPRNFFCGPATGPTTRPHRHRRDRSRRELQNPGDSQMCYGRTFAPISVDFFGPGRSSPAAWPAPASSSCRCPMPRRPGFFRGRPHPEPERSDDRCVTGTASRKADRCGDGDNSASANGLRPVCGTLDVGKG
jgi:hypothetical protein